MAGTIVSTPSLGASDWSSWITQQGLTDRGFLRVSLTNMSDTTASTIASGGVLECAGSIYSFTDTAISLATGTASASVAVYFYVIPSAGGTTCTIEMNSTAPTWRDDYQGFYASAASTTRVVGGCYIGSAAVYYNKYLYTGENLVYCLQTGATRPLLRKVYEMGEWNMNATASLSIPHGLRFTRIRRMDPIVRRDGDVAIYRLDHDPSNVTQVGGYVIAGATNLEVGRINTSYFDGVNFDATASTMANRGWITVEYEA